MRKSSDKYEEIKRYLQVRKVYPCYYCINLSVYSLYFTREVIPQEYNFQPPNANNIVIDNYP